MLFTLLLLLAVPCALLPLLVYVRNLPLYLPPPEVPERAVAAAVSVLIPARDEAAGIGATLDAVLASRGVALEVIVLDDSSTDGTAAIVQEYAARDPRVRLETAPPLPHGWCGKQHACWRLAEHSRQPVLVFLDADVRLAPDAVARYAAFLTNGNAALASGVPRQITGTILEKTLIPLIHFILLGFLPFDRMRLSAEPGLGAGCGQLFVAARDAYFMAGGHAGVRTSFHDGLSVPRAFRRAGYITDLFDATSTAECRMYTTARQVWTGLEKNATEAMASKALIGPMTVLLLAGQVLPWVLLIAWPGVWTALLAGLSILPRGLGAWRFDQSWLGVVLHPLSVVALVAMQWQAFIRGVRKKPSVWRGRLLQPGV